MTLSHRTAADTRETHIADHNALHDAYNAGAVRAASSFTMSAPINASALGAFSFPVWTLQASSVPGVPESATVGVQSPAVGEVALLSPGVHIVTLALSGGGLGGGELLAITLSLAYQHVLTRTVINSAQGFQATDSAMAYLTGSIFPGFEIHAYPTSIAMIAGLQISQATLDVLRVS